jgi:hypothetical protein
LLPTTARAAIPTEAARSITRSARESGFVGRVLIAIVIFSIGALFLIGGITSLYSYIEQVRLNRMPDGVEFLAVVLFFFTTVFIVAGISKLRGHSFLSPQSTARALARHGFCGCCAKPIADLPPDPDGLITCPACGAAWKPPPRAPGAASASPNAEPHTPTA